MLLEAGLECCCQAFVRKVRVLSYSTVHPRRLARTGGSCARSIVQLPSSDVYGAEKPGRLIRRLLVRWVVTNVEELAGKNMILMSICSGMGIFVGYFYCQQ